MKKTMKEVERDAQRHLWEMGQEGIEAGFGSPEREWVQRNTHRMRGVARLRKTGFRVVSLEDYDAELSGGADPLDELLREQLRMDPNPQWEDLLA